MANLQVKNLPNDLHSALRARAEREGITLSDLVTRLLRREVALPSMTEWLDEVSGLGDTGVAVDIPRLLDEVRGEAPRARR